MGAEGQERVARATGRGRVGRRWGAGLRYNGRAGRGAGLSGAEVGHTRAGTAETARKAEG
eukprot:2297038-Prymnesium_polylepis.1